MLDTLTFLLRSQVCTAIAVVAAREFHRVAGRCDEIFKSDTQVMDILSEGVVWHSRWLALDTDGSRTAFEVSLHLRFLLDKRHK